MDKELKEIEKAYGGCHNCYGKGYSTYRHAITASGDFIGEKDSTTPFKIHMNFCTCDRGKQLKELVLSQRADAVMSFAKWMSDDSATPSLAYFMDMAEEYLTEQNI